MAPPKSSLHLRTPRVSYHRQSANLGMVGNWGKGLGLARGEFVVFLSDDDQLGPHFLENRLAAFEDHPGAVVAFSRYEMQSIDGLRVGLQDAYGDTRRVLSPHELLLASLSRRWFIGASMYRRESIQKSWNEVQADDLVLDFSLNLRITLNGHGDGVYLPKNDFIMGVHPGQNSQAKREQVFSQGSAVLQRILAEGVPSELAALLRMELANWSILCARHLAASGRLPEARASFVQALKTKPTLLPAWRMLAMSWLCPGRLVASAKIQWPTE